MSGATKIERILLDAQCEPVAMTDPEVWKSQQRWREAYAGNLHAQTGKWVLHELDWHVFSYGKCVHKKGDLAWSAFRRVASGPFVVPMEWTMAFNHEHYGPYFALCR